MREISITLTQNINSTLPGDVLSITENVMAKMGNTSWSVDEQLGKVSPGDMTIEVIDPDDIIWDFINTSLAVNNSSLPPFLQVSVGGATLFTGTVDPSRIVRHLAADQHTIELGATDWSTMLANSQLDTKSFTRPEPRVMTTRSSGDQTFPAYIPGASAWRYNVARNAIIIPNAVNLLAAGNRITSTGWGAKQFTIIRVESALPDSGTGQCSLPPYIRGAVGWAIDPYVWPTGVPLTVAILDQDFWPYPGDALPYNSHTGYNHTCTLQASSVTPVSVLSDGNAYYTVKMAVAANPQPEVYEIYLDTIDGIMPMDTLMLTQGANAAFWTVESVDPERNVVRTHDAVKNLFVGDRIYFDGKTSSEMVMEDSARMLKLACLPYRCDLSRFKRTELTSPVFAWLPIHSLLADDDPIAISDIEPAHNSSIVYAGLTTAFSGDPDKGWTGLSSAPIRSADWTSQLDSSPASLMPYVLAYDSTYARRRNRVYHDFNYLSVDNGPVVTSGAPSTWTDGWTPAIGSTYPLIEFYDYLMMRKVKVTSLGLVFTQHWNGSGYEGDVAITWPTTNPVRSICNAPNSGLPDGSLVGITQVGRVMRVELYAPGHSSPAPLVVDNLSLTNAELVVTKNGILIMGATGYAQITPTLAGITMSPVATFVGSISCFWPNTAVMRSSLVPVIVSEPEKTSTGAVRVPGGWLIGYREVDELVVLTRLDNLSPDGKINDTETWLYRLNWPPISTVGSENVIINEPIEAGVPVFAGAQLDPAKPSRIIGHLGGRLWQLDNIQPGTIERSNPLSMAALEYIEHVTQLNNAMAIPLPDGTMSIVSRGVPETPIALTALQVKIDQAFSWPTFYSLIRCTTQDGKLWWDAPGFQTGGGLMEISNHPFLFSLSQTASMAHAYASWFGYARPQETQTWTWPNADTAPPWETILPYSRVTVNGTGPWRVMSLSQDIVNGTAEVLLVDDPEV